MYIIYMGGPVSRVRTLYFGGAVSCERHWVSTGSVLLMVMNSIHICGCKPQHVVATQSERHQKRKLIVMSGNSRICVWIYLFKQYGFTTHSTSVCVCVCVCVCVRACVRDCCTLVQRLQYKGTSYHSLSLIEWKDWPEEGGEGKLAH